MTSTTQDRVVIKGAPLRGTLDRQNLGVLVPLLPIVLFLGFFFFFPMAVVFVDSFKSNEGNWSMINIVTIFHDPYRMAFINSIKLGLVSAITASIPGALFAYVIETKGSQSLRRIVSSLSGVLANTGGVPLAFMFVAAFGAEGSAVMILKKLGWDLYAGNFSLFSFTGIVVVYLYFQIPLMIIVFSPAIHGIRKEWRDASQNLGATPLQFWRFIGLPLLLPSFAASFLLLFASAFAAYATARAMTVGNIALVPLQIGNLVDGNVSINQANAGKALAVGMVVISAIAMIPYLIIQRRARRWQT
ncbi:MAG: ABC transporter permease subunit [Actinomycetes bacterium]